VTVVDTTRAHASEPARQAVLGTQCFCGNGDEAAAAILARVFARHGGYGCFCNVHVVMSALHDERLRRSLDEAWLCFADGAPLAWMQRRTGHPEARRTAGPDLLPALVGLGQPYGLRHFLLGSTSEVCDRLRDRLLRAFPKALAVGSSSPPVANGGRFDEQLVREIGAVAPDIVWCAFGAPKQEIWMRTHHRALAPALLLGVGAAFEFNAGTKQRAPAAMQALGLEWLHRLASDPRRLGGRYLRTNTEFILRATAELRRSVAH
jgi:N-acetylglucosaminyldiphosphoundecaprenol N-acetyl-beta-D-mannosaminyltransferase